MASKGVRRVYLTSAEREVVIEQLHELADDYTSDDMAHPSSWDVRRAIVAKGLLAKLEDD